MKLFNGQQRIKQLAPDKSTLYASFSVERMLELRIKIFQTICLFALIGTLTALAIRSSIAGELSSSAPFMLGKSILFLLLLWAVRHVKSEAELKHQMILLFLVGYLFAFAEVELLGWPLNGDSLYGLINSIMGYGLLLVTTPYLIGIYLLEVTSALLVLQISHPWPEALARFYHLTFYWLSLQSLGSAIGLSVFLRWLFKEVFAYQFLMQMRREDIEQTQALLKRTEAQLVHQKNSQSINLMASGFLHEILNPINCSIQALNFARDISPNTAALQSVEQALKHQLAIADAVKDVKRFYQGPGEPETQLVRVDDMVQEALSLCQNELKGIELRTEQLPGCLLQCHRSAVVQALVNLLLNAATAQKLNPSADQGRIAITCVERDSDLTLSISDTGCGLSPELLEKLNSVDQQEQNIGDTDGSGLGISVIKTIMRHHHGSFEIDSKLNKGCSISLTFPRAHAKRGTGTIPHSELAHEVA